MKKFFLFLLTIVITHAIAYRLSEREVTIKVTDKERWVSSDEGKYLVRCGNTIYENSDSFLFLKFNSADLQGQLKVGETYVVNVAGWRIRFASEFPNIISKKAFMDSELQKILNE